MSITKVPKVLLVSAVAVAAVMCASTANAAAPVAQGKNPIDPVGPIAAELPPKEVAPQAAGRALADWIAEHPGQPGEGGVRILKDRTTVLVYWKGAVPAALQSLATDQPVPVTFRPAPYSRTELNAAMDAVIANNAPGTVTVVGSEPDYSSISVALSSKAPPNAFDQVRSKAATGIPITLRGIMDPNPLDEPTATTGSAPAAATCPVSARCGDESPFYGGSLIRIRGLSGACGTGASLFAGTYNYMSTAAHCGPGDGSGTYVAYDSGNVVGTVNVAAGHIVPSKDFMIIGTPSNAGRIWFGDWKTTTSIPVRRMERPFAGQGSVTCSCSASGSGHYQYLALDNERWWIHDHYVQPGFKTEPYEDWPNPDTPSTGWIQPGDSGSPIVRGGSSYYYLEGFMSAVGTGSSLVCAPGRHPGFNGDKFGRCYTEYWATYPDAAIGSLGGLSLKTS